MPGLYDVVGALKAMGAELKTVASAAGEATEKVEEHRRAREEDERKRKTSSTLTDMSPGRDRSRDMGAGAADDQAKDDNPLGGSNLTNALSMYAGGKR